MSRPEAHGQDYDHPAFDGRNSGEHGVGAQDYSGQFRDFMPSHGLRDSASGARDLGPQDYGATTFYNTSYSSSPPPPPFTADRRPLTSNAMPGAGFPSFVAPRMLNPAQGIGVGAGGNWNSKPTSFSAAPNAGRPSGEGSGGVSSQVQQSVVSPLVLNQHHRPSPPRGLPDLYTSPLHPSTPPFLDRDARDPFFNQRPHPQQSSSPLSVQLPPAQPQSLPSPSTATSSPRTTLWWGELEPWMDEEYAKQVCNLMGWDPISIKVPRPAPDPITGQQANNPGYCFLTFSTQAQAASVLSQVNNSSSPMIMPNSSKPFSLNWASSIPSAPLSTSIPGQTISIPGVQNPQYPKEYSIFVGDLAPEVSNSDLVAVFRNPVLGLRNDREPRFIRPFLSCKSAKIMLDPVTGVSRGYGFVRFTDEADQQRALIEMHGLYCLSRPMRISPATAKFKPAPGMTGFDLSQLPFPQVSAPPTHNGQDPSTGHSVPVGNAPPTKSVSAPLAGGAIASNSHNSLTSTGVSNSGSASSLSAPSLSSGTSATSSSTLASTSSDEALKIGQFSAANGSATSTVSNSTAVPSITAPFVHQTNDQIMAQRYNLSEESWKHHAQARAILSNLIGPNGEQLTSSDPYNTTVFVGGLSPLISEDTLRTFFAPFGEIHYVKVPVGKHCGFVQFVRKPDAERAIEKMQGFPIGGSRIRLSWGRSQYKAAQAAAQAAQAAAFQAQYQTQLQQTSLVQGLPIPPHQQSQPQPQGQQQQTLTHEQAIQLIEKFGLTNVLASGSSSTGVGLENVSNERQIAAALLNDVDGDRMASFNAFIPPVFAPRQSGNSATSSSFSPFSPDPNFLGERAGNDASVAQGQSLSQTPKNYSPWNPNQDEKVGSANGKVSPTSTQAARSSSATQRFTFLGDSPASTTFQPARTSSRQEAPIARPEAIRRDSRKEEYSSSAQGQEGIRDLNGTLASLSLDDHENGQSQTVAH
ncbi:hypothetical protein DICSQDRAFT_135856 [Dichomitus squalens LYAD-421 SS1]|uniref:RRM domain-containing protein n=1 Tax=Dichomitus squalens (strain LYAD-421) TaxID=732165 RepID=R7T1N4_DICSQ|nr:uncharacterized protein DICSQDRAFT_135856 [Dichomitus squalens LYAD-421 SS1]EJF62266.1 hypothetical protein DICSQDRAFT_135856 [Dichomitus squalens LYAD-421 SS1]